MAPRYLTLIVRKSLVKYYFFILKNSTRRKIKARNLEGNRIFKTKMNVKSKKWFKTTMTILPVG